MKILQLSSKKVISILFFIFFYFFSTQHGFCGIEYQWFDWDDNVVYMPTPLYIFPKSGHVFEREFYLEVSSDIFSILRDPIRAEEFGYSNYELNNEKGSFIRFSDDPQGSENFFLKDLLSLYPQNKKGLKFWQGPKWEDFVLALGSESSAEKVGIITSRKQSPETIFEGLKYFHEVGLIQYLPKLENIWAVGNPFFSERMIQTFGYGTDLSGEDPHNAAENKARLVRALLDRYFEFAICNGHTIIWKFSDDDKKNVISVAHALNQRKDSDFWKIFNIKIEYTGSETQFNFPEYENFTIEIFKGKLPHESKDNK